MIRECREELAVDVCPVGELPAVPHAYSHFSVTLYPFVCELHSPVTEIVAEAAAEARWISLDEIPQLPFPKATLKVFDQWRESML